MLSNILQLEGIMVLLAAVGVYLRRGGVITDEGRDCITDILMDVVLPCNIFLSFQANVDRETIRSFPVTILISVLVMVGTAALGNICYLRKEESQAKVFRYGLVNSNALFIGLPVVQSLLGQEGVLQLTIYMIFVRMFCWSYGLSLYTGVKADWRQSLRKLLLHPCMVAAALGLAVLLSGCRLPVFLSRTLEYCSSCLMALSMILIGVVLANLEIRHLVRADVLTFAALRLIVVPGAVCFGCLLFQMPPIVTATCTLLAGMPAASLTAVLAARYRGDAELGSLLVAVSTLLSAVTIPLWFLMLQ
ncbi:MAG: AEC family transporter [Lawsonibacter sp.]